MTVRRIRAILRKEVREILRDRYTTVIALVLPLVFLLFFAYAFNFDVADIGLAVWDQDRTPASRAYIGQFVASGYFHVESDAQSYAELHRLLARDQADAALIIPTGFARAIAAGRRAEVQTLVDGSFSPSAVVTMGYLEAMNARQSAAVLHRAALRGLAGPLAGASGPMTNGPGDRLLAVEARVWYNPSLASRNFIVPGLFAVILMAFPPLLSALAIARERELGSIQQLFISPIRPWELLVGKLLPYVALAFINMLLIFVTGRFWFGVPFRGSVPLFLAASVLYVFATVAIGLLVSTVTRTQLTAIFLTLILTLMPSMLFSGFLFPIYNMPVLAQWYTALFPARYYLETTHDILLKGLGLPAVWQNLVILTGYVLAILGLGVWRFRNRLA